MPNVPAKEYEETDEICICCGQPGRFSILLSDTFGRLYLPNQNARSVDSPPLKEVWFCKTCMRIVEDGFRKTIADLRGD